MKLFITSTCVWLFYYNILIFLFLSVFAVVIFDTYMHMYEYIPTTPSLFHVVHMTDYLVLDN